MERQHLPSLRDVAEDERRGVAHGVWATLQVLTPDGVDAATLVEIASEAAVDLDLLWPEGIPRPANAEGMAREPPAIAATPGDATDYALLSAAPHVRTQGGTPLREVFRSARANLAANKTRGFLTMLGIIIGVGAVVLLVSIGNGFMGYIDELYGTSGANNLTIQPTNRIVNGVDTGLPGATLSVEDARALTDSSVVPDALAVSPTVQQRALIRAGNVNIATTLIGVWPDYAVANSYKSTAGSFITHDDVAQAAPVVALGPTIAGELFGEADPVDQTIWLNNVALRVVGVMEAKGGPLFGGGDTSAYVPLSTASDRILGADPSVNDGTDTVDLITVRARSVDTIAAVDAECAAVLAARHGTGAATPDFSITTLLALMQQELQMIYALRVFVVAIAGISLLVGGIGIMNIMLVSVAERTREIGLRKAIGARSRDILTQFLVESMAISLLGAAIGFGIAALLALVVSLLWRPCPPSVAGVAVAVGAALATGLFFGVSPAKRAARLQPIEALRAE